jgi:hypothetical protein
MKKPLLSISPVVLLTIILITITSCNSKVSTPEQKENEIKTENKIADTKQNGSEILPRYLDTLYIESDKLLDNIDETIRNKITFRFYFINPDSLTIHGWINGSTSPNFRTLPDLFLLNGGKTNVPFGNGLYLGNSVLNNRSIDTIINKLQNNKHKFVVFVPSVPNSNNGQIIYTIHTSDNIKELSSFAPTNVTTNPSPPRNAN